VTDQDRPDERDLDGAADAWVRDLLAEARVTGPVPGDVAARLDETLAALRAERFGAGEPYADPAPVVPLRRRLAPLLAAAAAVVVVAGGAVGVTQLVQDRTGSSGSATGSVSADAGASSRSTAGASGAVPQLARATFAQDAAAVMRTLTVAEAGAASDAAGATPDATAQPQADTAGKAVAPPVTATPAPEALAAPLAGCPGPRAPGAVTVPATLDGRPVALVFRPPTPAAQRVEAWSCDGATLLVSASVPR
jgi:hypothetical protein